MKICLIAECCNSELIQATIIIVFRQKKSVHRRTMDTPNQSYEKLRFRKIYLFMASSMATATETVAPTMGLLPMPMRPIIST